MIEATKDDLIHLFGGPKPVVWSHLTDAVLARLGAVDSVRAASAAINEEFSWCGGGGRAAEAFVIADESVIGPENDDGIVMLDELMPWYREVAFQSNGVRRSAVDRMICALAILGSSGRGAERPSDDTLRKAQLVLSEILLDHPVLLHPRLVMPMRTRDTATSSLGVKHVSVVTAIMMTGLAQLPSVTQGIPEERIQAFAKSALLLAPIVRVVPKYALLTHKEGRKRIILDFPGESIQAGTHYAGRASSELLASLLEIARLREVKDKWPGHAAELVKNSQLLSALLHALPRVQGPNETLVSKFGTSVARGRPCAHLLDEFVQTKLPLHSEITANLPRFMQRVILRSDGAAPSVGDPSALPSWAAQENATQQFETLKRIGLAADGLRAAAWLYENLVGLPGNVGKSLPYATMPHAIGFLTALAESGFTVPGEPPSNLDGNGRIKGLASNRETWVVAHAMVSRRQAMESVLDGMQAAIVAVSDAEESAVVEPVRRRTARL